MDNFQIETAQNVSIQQKTAGIGERILAYIIDMAIIVVYEFGMFLLASAVGLERFEAWVYILVMGLPALLYFLLWETFWNGRTPGKAAMQLRVVNLDGSNPIFSGYLIRWLLRVIDISLTSGGVAVVTILFNGKGQRVGDIAAGTTVITEKKKTSLAGTLLVDIPADYVPKYPQVTVLKDEEIQTIKNLFQKSKVNANYNVVIALSERVANILEVTPDQKPTDFLSTVLMDYNYYTQAD